MSLTLNQVDVGSNPTGVAKKYYAPLRKLAKRLALEASVSEFESLVGYQTIVGVGCGWLHVPFWVAPPRRFESYTHNQTKR